MKRIRLTGSIGVEMSNASKTMVVAELRRGHAAILLVPGGKTCDVGGEADRDSKERL